MQPRGQGDWCQPGNETHGGRAYGAAAPHAVSSPTPVSVTCRQQLALMGGTKNKSAPKSTVKRVLVVEGRPLSGDYIQQTVGKCRGRRIRLHFEDVLGEKQLIRAKSQAIDICHLKNENQIIHISLLFNCCLLTTSAVLHSAE